MKRIYFKPRMDVHKLRSNRPIIAGSIQPQGKFNAAETSSTSVYTNKTIDGGNAMGKGMDFDDDFDY